MTSLLQSVAEKLNLTSSSSSRTDPSTDSSTTTATGSETTSGTGKDSTYGKPLTDTPFSTGQLDNTESTTGLDSTGSTDSSDSQLTGGRPLAADIEQAQYQVPVKSDFSTTSYEGSSEPTSTSQDFSKNMTSETAVDNDSTGNDGIETTTDTTTESSTSTPSTSTESTSETTGQDDTPTDKTDTPADSSDNSTDDNNDKQDSSEASKENTLTEPQEPTEENLPEGMGSEAPAANLGEDGQPKKSEDDKKDDKAADEIPDMDDDKNQEYGSALKNKDGSNKLETNKDDDASAQAGITGGEMPEAHQGLDVYRKALEHDAQSLAKSAEMHSATQSPHVTGTPARTEH